MTNIDDSFLLKRLREGDIYALETLFNKHYSNLCRYLLLLFKNQFLVEHIAQDIFIYLWENRKTIKIKSSIESYLYAAGRYKALNKIRDTKRHEEILKEIGKEKKNEEDSSHNLLEIDELKIIIEEAINTLPERCQQIFRLNKEEDISYKEIAKLLNISVNTVENQMTIALKKLRKILRPFYLKIFFTALLNFSLTF